MKYPIEKMRKCLALLPPPGGEVVVECLDEIELLRQQLAARDAQIESLKASMYGHYELEKDCDTAWAQAHRLALELECLIMDTKDNATVSKWWDSAFEAIEEYNKLKPGAAEDAEAWAKMRKAGI